MLVHRPGEEPVLLDFFVAAPGLGGLERGSELEPVEIDFGDATQVFNVGAASCGVPGRAERPRRGGGAVRLDAARRPARRRRRGSPATASSSTAAAGLPARDPGADPGPRAAGAARSTRPAARCSARASGSRFAELGGDARAARGARARSRSTAVTSRARSPTRVLASGAARSAVEDLAAYETIAREPVAGAASAAARSSRTRPRPRAGS